MFEEKINKLISLMNNGKLFFKDPYYKTNQEFLGDCKLYLNVHPDKYHVIKLLIDVVTCNKKNKIFFIDSPEVRYEKKYIYKFQQILSQYIIDKEKAYKVANNLYSSSKSYQNALKLFENMFINAEVFMPALIDVKNHIVEDKKITGTYVCRLTSAAGRDYLDIVYESGLSLIDYAHYNLIDYPTYNSAIYSRKDQKAMEVKARPVTTLPILLDIIEKISNDELTYVDYFKLTKLSPHVIRLIANEHKLNNKNFSMFITKYMEKNGKINKESELSAVRYVNNELIPRETIENIFTYLEENNIPITSRTFNELLNDVKKKKTLKF